MGSFIQSMSRRQLSISMRGSRAVVYTRDKAVMRKLDALVLALQDFFISW